MDSEPEFNLGTDICISGVEDVFRSKNMGKLMRQ